MSEGNRAPSFPRGVLFGAGALLAFVLILVAVARIGGFMSSAPPAAPAVASVDLRFEDHADGSVGVYRAGETEAFVRFEPGHGGFVRGVLRGLARERRQHDVGAGPPFRLTQFDDGRLALEDLGTGRVIELTAFGPTNAQTFAALLDAEGADG